MTPTFPRNHDSCSAEPLPFSICLIASLRFYLLLIAGELTVVSKGLMDLS